MNLPNLHKASQSFVHLCKSPKDGKDDDEQFRWRMAGECWTEGMMGVLVEHMEKEGKPSPIILSVFFL